MYGVVAFAREVYKLGSSRLVLALGALASLSTALGSNGDHCSRHARGGGLVDEGLVDVGDHTTTGDGGTDEGVKFLVSADGEQQVTGCDTLHLEILAGITGKLKHLSSQVLHNSRGVDSGGGTNTLLAVHTSLQESVDTTDRELQTSTTRSGLGCALGAGSLSSPFPPLPPLRLFLLFLLFLLRDPFCNYMHLKESESNQKGSGKRYMSDNKFKMI